MKGTQRALAVQLRDTASFANYWPGHNADVVAALRELQHPTLLYGPTQSGRTHLLQAVCRERSGGYLPLREVLAYGPEALQGFEQQRSEERRVGKECVSTCRSRWSPHH